MGNVTPVQLKRFFSATTAGYKIAKKVREVCVFAMQDVTHDPPYSRIDLVTCCNVLIYFGLSLQKKAASLIHYALVPDGFLMLGTAENLRTATSLFRPSGTKPMIYRKEISDGRAGAERLVQLARQLAGPASEVEDAHVRPVLDQSEKIDEWLFAFGFETFVLIGVPTHLR